MAFIRLVWLGLALCLSIGAAEAQFLTAETLEIPSTNFSDQQFLDGSAGSAPPVSLTGVLVLRDVATPQPVVILLHGSNGPSSSAVSGWHAALKDMGYATLRLDSFGGRGLGQIGTDLQAASSFAQVYDAYRAVERLSADPRVDASRIVVMGFSRGGIAALYGSLRRFHETYGPSQGRIAGYLPFYPSCNFELKRGDQLVDAPVREFHGSADDGSSAQTCREYIEGLAAAGADIAITVYEGARHAFDASQARFAFRADDVQHSFDCMRIEGEGGVLLNRDTGLPFTYADGCVGYGMTYQYDKAATTAAMAAVQTFLAETVGAPERP